MLQSLLHAKSGIGLCTLRRVSCKEVAGGSCSDCRRQLKMLDVAATKFGWNPQTPGQERQTEFRAQEPWTAKYGSNPGPSSTRSWLMRANVLLARSHKLQLKASNPHSYSQALNHKMRKPRQNDAAESTAYLGSRPCFSARKLTPHLSKIT